MTRCLFLYNAQKIKNIISQCIFKQLLLHHERTTFRNLRRSVRGPPLLPAQNRAEAPPSGKPVRPQHDVHAKLRVPGRNHPRQVRPHVRSRVQAGRFQRFQVRRLHAGLPAHHRHARSGRRRVGEKMREQD